MTIQEMHTVFRTLGQQMGLQQVRGILPESIDIYLNDAIIEKVRSTVILNTGTTIQDKVTQQHNPISPINSLRTIYKTVEFKVGESTKTSNYYKVSINIDNVMLFTSFFVNYTDNLNKKYACRIIESDKLENTLNDYCNKASYEYPIVSIFYDVNTKQIVRLFTNSDSKIPESLEVRYVENPAKVKFDENTSNCIDCNLPDYIHFEIVEMAVYKYLQSVTSTTKPISNQYQ